MSHLTLEHFSISHQPEKHSRASVVYYGKAMTTTGANVETLAILELSC